jgi:hypothetical protein
VLVLEVNTPFGTTQEVVVGQFGPVTTICAVDVLKLLPLIVNENEPGDTVAGEMLLIEGTLWRKNVDDPPGSETETVSSFDCRGCDKSSPALLWPREFLRWNSGVAGALFVSSVFLAGVEKTAKLKRQTIKSIRANCKEGVSLWVIGGVSAFMDFSRALYGANSKIDLSVSKRSARRKTHPGFLSTRELFGEV